MKLMEIVNRALILLAAVLICAGVIMALGAEEHQPRTLGNTAVMHIYYYAPKTLEITYVDSYLFKDETACKNAVNDALRIAMPTAGAGDLVSAQCVGMTPPKAVIKPPKSETAKPEIIKISDGLIPKPDSDEPGAIFMFTDCGKHLMLESITGEDWHIALAFNPHFEKAWGMVKELQDAGKNVETIEVRKVPCSAL
jgi:hypothetical protein